MATRRGFVTSLAHLGAGAYLTSRWSPALEAAQTVASDKVFRIDAELVPTAVTVRDASGRLVTSLDRDDFAVREGGADMPVTQFARERVPVSLALVLDISDSMRGPRMEDAKAALATFVEQLLKPEDEAALLVFNHATRQLTEWTTDRAVLRLALDEARPTGGTAIYDAVLTALPLFATRSHPRAAIVLVSDGADTASDTTIVDLKQQLSRGDVFLYGIAVDTPNARSSRRINPQVFRELSAVSGGYAEIVSSSADIMPAAVRIAEELNAQYMIGYTPTSPGDGRYRAIRVTVDAGDGYVVRARRGVVR